jgi:hypothetical protein
MNQSPNNPTLDLDQLLGEARPIVIIYQSKEYRLSRPESLTPKRAADLWRAKRGMDEFRKAGILDDGGKVDEKKMTAKWEQRMMQFIGEAIKIVSPELAALDLPLPKLLAVFEFYSKEVSKDLPNSKPAEEAGSPSPIPSPA